MDDSDTTRAKSELNATRPLLKCRTARAANAVTHGLSAAKLLPEILGRELLQRHRRNFHEQWKPSTVTEECLVEELARHAAALERATPIEEAVLRTSALGLAMLSERGTEPDARADCLLAAACGTESVDRLTRYRQAHEKGFHTALARLRELRSSPPCVHVPLHASLSSLSFDERACLRYLRQRHDNRSLCCPSCGSRERTWLAGRARWQCRECRRQLGLRSRTVMARSPVPLQTWFCLIAAILHDRQVSTDALCRVTGIRREKTVREMAKRVRDALDSPDAERLLAGLDAQILASLARSSC
jgi:transposase-like protein